MAKGGAGRTRAAALQRRAADAVTVPPEVLGDPNASIDPRGGDGFAVRYVPVNEASGSLKTQLFDITRGNMDDIYKLANFNLTATRGERWAEMFHSTARLIVLSPADAPDEVAGFVILRFEVDDSEPEVRLFIWEIQVPPPLQGRAIGTFLMASAERVARHFKLNSVDLNLQLVNTRACRFYKERLGFEVVPRFTPAADSFDEYPRQGWEWLAKKL